MPGRKRKMGDYDMNYQPSAINNFTPLPVPFWSCMEAAVAENRSGPMWLWLVVVNFIVSTAHSRATEPVIGGALPLVGICLAEISHGGYWSCYKVSSHNYEKNEPKNQRTNRVTISSRKGTCYWAVIIVVVVVYWSVTEPVVVRRSSCYCCCYCGLRSFTMSGPAHSVSRQYILR